MHSRLTTFTHVSFRRWAFATVLYLSVFLFVFRIFFLMLMGLEISMLTSSALLPVILPSAQRFGTLSLSHGTVEYRRYRSATSSRIAGSL